MTLTINTCTLARRSLQSPAVRVQPLRSGELPVVHVTISMTDRVADEVVPFAMTAAAGVGDHTLKSGVPTPGGVGEPGGVPTPPVGGGGGGGGGGTMRRNAHDHSDSHACKLTPNGQYLSSPQPAYLQKEYLISDESADQLLPEGEKGFKDTFRGTQPSDFTYAP